MALRPFVPAKQMASWISALRLAAVSSSVARPCPKTAASPTTHILITGGTDLKTAKLRHLNNVSASE